MSEDRKSKADPSHITQMTFDEEAWAVRTRLVDTEINMELSADDGDSVLSHPCKLMASAMECHPDDASDVIIPPMDCSNLRELHVAIEGTGTVDVLVSPLDSGNFFYKLGEENVILKVCARRVMVKRVVPVLGNVHLVGRS